MKGGDPNPNRRPTTHVVADSAMSARNQIDDLQTPNHYWSWEKQHAETLNSREATRRHQEQEAEAARFAKAQDAVISAVKRWRRDGLSLQAAGRKVIEGSFCSGFGYTYTDALTVLRALGASPSTGRRLNQGGEFK